MTVIAFKDGIMAGDGQSFQNGRRYRHIQPKISRHESLGLMGAAGRASDCGQAHAWFVAGMPEEKPSFSEDKEIELELLWAKLDGSLWWADCRLAWIEIPAPAAIGESSASDFVEGAMLSGSGAERAVKLAVKHCIYIGGAVTVERLSAKP